MKGHLDFKNIKMLRYNMQ